MPAVKILDAGISIPRIPKPKDQLALYNRLMQFANSCHNPEGPAGGQFCSDNVEYSKVSPWVKKRLEKTISSINKIHDTPEGLPKVTVEESIRGNMAQGVDGFYEAANNHIVLNNGIEHMEITLVHELGHHLSLQGQKDLSVTPTLKAVLDATKSSDTIQGLQERYDKRQDPYDAYLLDEREVFARAYAQWIALRSKDKVLKEQHKYNLDVNMTWSDKEFTPIAEALDKHFNK